MRRNVQRAFGGRFDPWLLPACVALVCIGLLMVYSASIADAYVHHGTPYYIIERELAWVVLGFVLLTVTARTDYNRWKQLASPLFIVTVALLFIVLVPHVGHVSNGARRWFSLGSSLTLQPSEVIKLTLAIFLAKWLPAKGAAIQDFREGFVPFSAVIGVIFLAIVTEPDLGTAMVVGGMAIAIFFVAGAAPKHLLLVAAGSVACAYALVKASRYQQIRFQAFLNPWHDPTGVGYHIRHALLALGSGGIVGRGLGNSLQKNVLPAPHTDSILAVLGEEFGLVGTLLVLLLFLVLAYRGIRIALAAPDSFGLLLGVGITCWISFQALLNFAVITSSVPFTGVPLPFISYGGSSLLITMAAMGILLNISRHAVGESRARQSTYNGRGNGRARIPRVIDHPVSDRSLGKTPRRLGTQAVHRPRPSHAPDRGF